MKTYEAEYFDKSDKLVIRATFDASNKKEAWSMAQIYKNKSPEIQEAGRVKTYVGCRATVIKKFEKAIREAEEMKRERDEYLKEINK